MEFTGKWACPEYLDAQLNVMPDGAEIGRAHV